MSTRPSKMVKLHNLSIVWFVSICFSVDFQFAFPFKKLLKIEEIMKAMKPNKFWIDGHVFCLSEGYRALNVENLSIKPEQGKYLTSFKLPNAYYKKLLFHPKLNMSILKHKKSIKISLPKRATSSLGSITITGDTEADVQEARLELHELVAKIRSNMRPKQFISIPTKSEEFQSNFIKFKENVLQWSDEIENLEQSIFVAPEKLHMTVCVLNLLDDVEIEEACKTLENLKNDVLCPLLEDKGEIRLQLNGIYSMSNSKNSHVLYTDASIVEETPEFNMQMLANLIAEYFYDRGLVVQHKDNVKIHVTLINTKYRLPKDRRRDAKRISIDASRILEEYKDHNFGTCPLQNVHLSLMSSVGKDGYYEPISIVQVCSP